MESKASPAKKRRVNVGKMSENRSLRDALRSASSATNGVDMSLILEQTRDLVSASLKAHDYESAAWYADKACSLSSGNNDDLFSLANVYFCHGQYARSLGVLEFHGLIDIEKQADRSRTERQAISSSDDNMDKGAPRGKGDRGGRATASAPGAEDDYPAVPAQYHGAVKPASLRYFHLAACCLAALCSWERCVLLLESCMEGRGRPGLRVPLRIAPPAVAMALTAWPGGTKRPAAVGKSVAHPPSSSSFSSRPLEGLDGPLPDEVEEVDMGDVGQGGGARGGTHGRGTTGCGASTAGMGTTGGSCSSGAVKAGVRDGTAVWHIIRHMALQHCEQVLAAAHVSAPGAVAVPAALFALDYVPVGSGQSLNIVACLSVLRGRALLALDNRLRAAQWFIAALRIDPYAASALHALVDHSLCTCAEEAHLEAYLASVLLPVPASTTPCTHPHSVLRPVFSCARALAAAQSYASVLGRPRSGEGVGTSEADRSSVMADGPTPVTVGAGLTRTRSASGRGLAAAGSKVAVPPPVPPSQSSASAGGGSEGELDAPVLRFGGAGVQVVKMSTGWLNELYACRLNRYALVPPLAARFSHLEGQYGAGLGSAGAGRVRASLDVMAAKADARYAQQDVEGALSLSRRVLSIDPMHPRAALVYYACCVGLGKAPDLFAAAHAAVEASPRSALSWYAVGCYYLCLGKLTAAVRPLVRSTELDKSFAPAWAGLGLAYAGSEEVEPALAAYRTAMRLAPNAHTPPLAMAALCLRQGSLPLARQYLDMSLARCAHDPAVYHEAGVLEWEGADLEGVHRAVQLWEAAAGLLAGLHATTRRAHEPTYVCLGHGYRKLGRWADAQEAYAQALALRPGRPATLAAVAFTHQLAGDPTRAAELYHAVLLQSPDDAFVNRMMKAALVDLMDGPSPTMLEPPAHAVAGKARTYLFRVGPRVVAPIDLDGFDDLDDGRAGGQNMPEGDMDEGEEGEEFVAAYGDDDDDDEEDDGEGEDWAQQAGDAGMGIDSTSPVGVGAAHRAPPANPGSASHGTGATPTAAAPPLSGMAMSMSSPAAVDFSQIISPVAGGMLLWSTPGPGGGPSEQAGADVGAASAAPVFAPARAGTPVVDQGEDSGNMDLELSDFELATRLQQEELAGLAGAQHSFSRTAFPQSSGGPGQAAVLPSASHGALPVIPGIDPEEMEALIQSGVFDDMEYGYEEEEEAAAQADGAVGT